MFRFFYNLFLPIGFLFFVPGLLLKYRNRGGWKDTFGERFGHFTPKRMEELKAFHGAIWVHAVSVGEAVIALSMIREWHALHPERKFVISTTTTRSWCASSCRQIRRRFSARSIFCGWSGGRSGCCSRRCW